MAHDSEPERRRASRIWPSLAGLGLMLRLLEQRLQRARRAGYALRLGARRPQIQAFLAPVKSSDAELMQ